MPKNNKPTIIKELNCLNCGFPFSGQENFCPECGQKDKDNKLTFGSFTKEVFNGFTSWDAKFWTTIIPLLTKPGKVSLDYIEGKRNRYTNPFRFYLTVSILFFLIIGLTNSYNDFKKLSTSNNSTSIKNKTVIIDNKEIPLDSIKNVVLKEYKKEKTRLDSLKKKPKKGSKLPKNMTNMNFSIAGFQFGPFMKFQKKHPEMEMDIALDSLHKEKNFTNRLMYKRAKALNSLGTTNDEYKKVINETIGYISIALFILLPIFALFLKLIYIRRKKTYVAHLVFVFHTQTVFFLLLIIFYILNFIKISENILGVFLLLFLLYLYLAMKKFYKQGYGKTFVKFILANTAFLFLSIFGGIIISAIALLVF